MDPIETSLARLNNQDSMTHQVAFSGHLKIVRISRGCVTPRDCEVVFHHHRSPSDEIADEMVFCKGDVICTVSHTLEDESSYAWKKDFRWTKREEMKLYTSRGPYQVPYPNPSGYPSCPLNACSTTYMVTAYYVVCTM